MNVKDWTAQYITGRDEYQSPILIGVTGTIGKTTVAELIYQYLCYCGERTMLIATSGIKCKAGNYLHSNFPSTSPTDKNMLATFLSGAMYYNCKYVVLETTAETMSVGVYEGLNFDYMAVTNFKKDIVRSFKDDEEYFYHKNTLFRNDQVGTIICKGSYSELIETKKSILTYKRVYSIEEGGYGLF
jgi:UDP-N-acetylmuramoyl-L-alanyl-D-glutamate--2,6-diaminopimelate ligase